MDDVLSIEYFLEREGIDYRVRNGHSGEQLNVKICPFCGNEKWKVYINAESGAGNCFRCDATFNAYKFIRASTSLSGALLSKYINNLKQELGWRPPKLQSKETILGKIQLPPLQDIYESNSSSYIASRGIDNVYCRYFSLAFISSGYYRDQDFSGRIFIPIYDLEGNLVTFQGRDISNTKDRKYLFPIGLPGTARFLYNGWNYDNETNLVLCEGAFDVIATKIALDQDQSFRDYFTIGSFGKNLSLLGSSDNQLSDLLKLKSKKAKRIFFLWDGEVDPCKKAVDQGLELNRYGFETFLCFLPKDKDPNEVDGLVVRQAISSAQQITKRNALQLLKQSQQLYGTK